MLWRVQIKVILLNGLLLRAWLADNQLVWHISEQVSEMAAKRVHFLLLLLMSELQCLLNNWLLGSLLLSCLLNLMHRHVLWRIVSVFHFLRSCHTWKYRGWCYQAETAHQSTTWLRLLGRRLRLLHLGFYQVKLVLSAFHFVHCAFKHLIKRVDVTVIVLSYSMIFCSRSRQWRHWDNWNHWESFLSRGAICIKLDCVILKLQNRLRKNESLIFELILKILIVLARHCIKVLLCLVGCILYIDALSLV
jgi:hypothetical protein